MNRKSSAENPRSGQARAPSAQPRTVLQEVFARRRETEQIRTEKNSAVAQYYDKWGRITSRFQNWTTPEYYENSDLQIRRDVEAKRREEEMLNRRNKLSKVLASDKTALEKELKQQQRDKLHIRQVPTNPALRHDVNVLQRLNSKLDEQERQRKELESKLYSRWRLGFTRDEMILQSRNQHQAMAKLNWLDQQVEEQLERDRCQREYEIMAMKRKSELLREEAIAQEAVKAREREVAELKELLEFHCVELKAREAHSRQLKEQTATVEDIKKNLEIKQQELTALMGGRRLKAFAMHNTRRLKVLVLEFCENISDSIRNDMGQLTEIRMLLRGQLLGPKEEDHFQRISTRFEQDIVDLKKDADTFSAMYDSEVKARAIKQQDMWSQNAETRFRLLKNLLQELVEKCDILISCNTEEIMSIMKIKEGHLNSIDVLHSKLQVLECIEPSTRTEKTFSEETHVDQPPRSVSCAKSPVYLSLGEQMEGMRLAVPQNVPSTLPDRKKDGSPRFGRRKVAWY